MNEHGSAETLDVKGQNCPMPVVKTKQAIDRLAIDDVLEVLVTDPGSMSDPIGWSETTDGVELLDQEEGDDVYTLRPRDGVSDEHRAQRRVPDGDREERGHRHP